MMTLLDRDEVMNAIRAVKLLNPSEEREAALDQAMDAVMGLHTFSAGVSKEWHEAACKELQDRIDRQAQQIRAMRKLLLVQLLEENENEVD